MIHELLKYGRRNAVSPDYLKKLLGLTSTRAVQKQVEYERRQGKVILSNTQAPGGYFLPETRQEIECFIKTLENRGNSTLEILDSSKKLLKEFEIRDDK